MKPRSSMNAQRTRFAVAAFVLGVAIVMVCWVIGSATEPNGAKKLSNAVVGFGGAGVVVHPISLHVTYRDKEIIPGEQGEAHAGVATYVLKNHWPTPMKIIFPPIGYTSGAEFPLTPFCCDVQRMPEFCRAARVIELAGFAERSFTAGYTIICA